MSHESLVFEEDEDFEGNKARITTKMEIYMVYPIIGGCTCFGMLETMRVNENEMNIHLQLGGGAEVDLILDLGFFTTTIKPSAPAFWKITAYNFIYLTYPRRHEKIKCAWTFNFPQLQPLS